MLIGTRRTFTTSGQAMDEPEGETERDDQKKTGHAKYAAKRGGTCLALLLGVRHVRDGAAEWLIRIADSASQRRQFIHNQFTPIAGL